MSHCVSGLGAILGGSRQRERIATSLGHVWRSREGSTFRVRQVRTGESGESGIFCGEPILIGWISRQVRRRFTMLLHNQPRFLAELQGDVVSRDKEVLPANTGPTGRMQKRSAIHVSGRDLSQLFSRPQSLCEVSHLPARGDSFEGIRRKESFRSSPIVYVRSAAPIPGFLLRLNFYRCPITDNRKLQILIL